MDAQLVQIVLYLTVLFAVVARLFASAGWKLTPAIDENGKFQLNVVFIILTGFMTSIAVLESLDLTSDILILVVTTFTAVYGSPAVLDKVGTAITPTPQQTAPLTETKTTETITPDEEVDEEMKEQ